MLLISDEYEPLQKSLAQFNFDEYFEDMYKVQSCSHLVTIFIDKQRILLVRNRIKNFQEC
jgi:hypothetical protein